MNFLTNREKTPLQFTLLFIIALPVAYAIYFTFARDYGSFLMMISSNLVATMFDMHVVTSGSYLTDVTLISNIGLQNSITNEVAYAQLPLNEAVVDKLLGVITNTSIVIALSLLLVRSFKVLAIVMSVMVVVHIFSVSALMTYFMIELSLQSPILMNYLQAFGVNQLFVNTSYIFSGISYYYLKYFTPFALAFFVWESHGYLFIKKTKQNIVVATILNRTNGM